MSASSSSSLDTAAILKAKLLTLDKERVKIQQDIDANMLILGPVGMNQPLVDVEGFPRGDIDIYAIRAARNKIICLRNDLKTKEKEIEDTLPVLHALGPLLRIPNLDNSMSTNTTGSSSTNNGQSNTSSSASTVASSSSASSNRSSPFALVDGVSPASPAYTAGLRIHDQIIQFGTVHSRNPSTPNVSLLTEVGQYVQSHANQAINVIVQRNGTPTDTTSSHRYDTGSNVATDPNITVDNHNTVDDHNHQILTLSLTPQRWSGPGLLGCHIVPL